MYCLHQISDGVDLASTGAGDSWLHAGLGISLSCPQAINANNTNYRPAYAHAA